MQTYAMECVVVIRTKQVPGVSKEPCQFLLLQIEDNSWKFPSISLKCGESFRQAEERFLVEVGIQNEY